MNSGFLHKLNTMTENTMLVYWCFDMISVHLYTVSLVNFRAAICTMINDITSVSLCSISELIAKLTTLI
jgi:hypothetical protein